MSTYEQSRYVLQPRQKRSREALGKIVAAAEHILRAEGYDGFSIAAVAEASGLPVGNIYRRFTGKAELLLAVKENVTARIEKRVEEHLSHKTIDDAHGLIREFVATLVETFTSDENVHHILFDDRVRNPEMEEIGSSGRVRIFTAFRDRILPYLGHLDADRADMLARLTFHIIASAVVDKASGREPILDTLSWDRLETEVSIAAITYLQQALVADPPTGNMAGPAGRPSGTGTRAPAPRRRSGR